MPVIFDGAERLIICTSGTTALNVQNDIYSPWKEWVRESDNSKYVPAMRVVGGDPISGSFSLGATFFLINDWKIRPQESNHNLDVAGNIFVDPSGSQFVQTIGNYNVLIRMTVSNLIDLITVDTGGTDSISFTEDDRTALRAIYSGTAPGAGVSGTFSVSDRNAILSIFSGSHLGSNFTLNLQDRTTINAIFSGTHAGVLTGSFTPLDRLILNAIFSGSNPGAPTGSFTIADRTIVYAIYSGTHLDPNVFNTSDRTTINSIYSGTYPGMPQESFTATDRNTLLLAYSGTQNISSSVDFLQTDRITLNSIFSGSSPGTSIFNISDRNTIGSIFDNTQNLSSSIDFLSSDRTTLNAIYSGTNPGAFTLTSSVNISSESITNIVNRVWDEPMNQHVSSGSTGFIINKLERISGSIEFNRAMQGGRWRLNNNQMIFYGEDNTTVIAIFDLYDMDGSPCWPPQQQNVPAERRRVF